MKSKEVIETITVQHPHGLKVGERLSIKGERKIVTRSSEFEFDVRRMTPRERAQYMGDNILRAPFNRQLPLITSLIGIICSACGVWAGAASHNWSAASWALCVLLISLREEMVVFVHLASGRFSQGRARKPFRCRIGLHPFAKKGRRWDIHLAAWSDLYQCPKCGAAEVRK